MSKRNFILLIIILAIVVIGVFGFLYLNSSGTSTRGNPSTGTNFLSQFNPFASKPNTNNNAGTQPPAIDTNGDGVITPSEMEAIKLKKVSSMPIAGFTIFSKERLKDVPLPTPPSATTTDTTTPQTTTSSGTPPKVVATKKNGTKKITPVAPPTEFAIAVRYVERATGNIYQTFADKLAEKKFSTTVIPKIYDAYFGNLGQSVVMRHLKGNGIDIETFSGSLPKEIIGADTTTDNTQIKGAFLSDGIKDISLSPDTSKIFYLTNIGGSSGSAIGTVLSISDGKKTQVFNSAFTEWNSFWPNNNIITLTTKPASGVLGYMYMIDVAKKNFTQILGKVNGLTTLMSPDGKLVLVGDSNLGLYTYHTDTKNYDTLGVKTLPDKCVWNKTSDAVYCAVPVEAPTGAYPDDWYRGEVSFSDQIWKINTKNGTTSMITDPILVQGGEDIDGTKLALDPDENYLFFVNKKDSFLWELQLK